MKWVVISLLLLNAVFLAVQLNKKEQVEQAEEEFPYSGEKLVLLAEKDMQNNARPLVERKRPIPAAKRLPKPAQKATAATKTEIKAKSLVTNAVSAIKPAAKPEPMITSLPKPVPTPVTKSISAAMACYSVGPFLLISDVKAVGQLFERSAINTQERSEAQRKQVGYWVYIPPAASSQLAQGVLRQLINNDVADAVIITEGTKANAISAGVYKTEQQGRQKLTALAQLGYQAKIEPLFRTQPQYWLDLELMQLTQLPDTLWREVTAGYPKIKQMRRKCGQ